MTDNDDDNRAIGIDGKPSELKSLIDYDRPLNEILRAQCKYEHPKAPAHIIVHSQSVMMRLMIKTLKALPSGL